jgi:hypothetical protein
MLRHALMAFTCLASAAGLSAAAHATDFGYGFLIDFGNGDGATGLGHLFTTDNGDGTYTVTGADGAATYISFGTGETYAGATILGAGASIFAPDGTVATIVLQSDGSYSFDNLALFGTDFRFYDFSHDEDGDLIGFSTEVGGPAQFQFGLDEEDPSPAPEAATWGMMVLGFGAMGAAMRRRTTVSFA